MIYQDNTPTQLTSLNCSDHDECINDGQLQVIINDIQFQLVNKDIEIEDLKLSRSQSQEREELLLTELSELSDEVDRLNQYIANLEEGFFNDETC